MWNAKTRLRHPAAILAALYLFFSLVPFMFSVYWLYIWYPMNMPLSRVELIERAFSEVPGAGFLYYISVSSLNAVVLFLTSYALMALVGRIRKPGAGDKKET